MRTKPSSLAIEGTGLSEIEMGSSFGEGSPRAVETTRTGRVEGSGQESPRVLSSLGVGVYSQDEIQDSGLAIVGSFVGTESRVQATPEWEGGQDDHRKRDPGGGGRL